jgi:putative YphP/YqiW family bacilliredoxin
MRGEASGVPRQRRGIPRNRAAATYELRTRDDRFGAALEYDGAGPELMPYPEHFVEPMRRELTSLGVTELRTPQDVDAAVRDTPGTLMIVVNSVCGCAAGRARPGVALALRHAVRPDVVASVFAGFDVDATDRARAYFTGCLPSSPSIALLRNGALVYLLERSQIESRDATAIAAELTSAFDRFCAAAPA